MHVKCSSHFVMNKEKGQRIQLASVRDENTRQLLIRENTVNRGACQPRKGINH